MLIVDCICITGLCFCLKDFVVTGYLFSDQKLADYSYRNCNIFDCNFNINNMQHRSERNRYLENSNPFFSLAFQEFQLVRWHIKHLVTKLELDNANSWLRIKQCGVLLFGDDLSRQAKDIPSCSCFAWSSKLSPTSVQSRKCKIPLLQCIMLPKPRYKRHLRLWRSTEKHSPTKLVEQKHTCKAGCNNSLLLKQGTALQKLHPEEPYQVQ